MKTFLLLPFLFLGLVVHAQKDKKKEKIITDQKKVFEAQEEFWEMNYMDTISCENLTVLEPGIVIYLPILDPEANDEDKKSTIQLLENELKEISGYQDCYKGKAICFKLIDGLFLSKQEVADIYASDSWEDLSRINIERFVKLYGALCSKYFPGNQLYIEAYNW